MGVYLFWVRRYGVRGFWRGVGGGEGVSWGGIGSWGGCWGGCGGVVGVTQERVWGG